MASIDLIGVEPSGLHVPMLSHSAVQTCEHKLIPKPAFDEDEAEGLSAVEVRSRWPRSHSRCPNCGREVVTYASMAHYIYGDF